MSEATSRRGENVHVVSNPRPKHISDRWHVKHMGNVLETARYQHEAREKARPYAEEFKCEVKTHGLNGRIRTSDSYGNDPREVKG